MRHLICLLIATSLLFSSLPSLAQSSGCEKKPAQSNQSQVKKPRCDRVVITLKTGEKMEGCYEWRPCDFLITGCYAQIRQKGLTRRIPVEYIASLDEKRSFWRKVKEGTLTIIFAPLLFLICLKDCEL